MSQTKAEIREEITRLGQEVIREAQAIQVSLEQKNSQTPDVNLMPEVDRLNALTQKVSDFVHAVPGEGPGEENTHQTALETVTPDTEPELANPDTTDTDAVPAEVTAATDETSFGRKGRR